MTRLGDRPAGRPRQLLAERVAIVSDLHLRGGAGGEPLEGDLGRIVEHLGRTHDWVILNGDIFDLDRGALPLAFDRALGQVLARHAETLCRAYGPRVVWLVGNHDARLQARGLAEAAVDVRLPCGRFRVEHGHRFDPPIKRWRAFTSLVTWVDGRVEAAGLGLVERTMRQLDRVLSAPASTECPVEEKALSWLERSSYDGLIIGHTHRRCARQVGAKWLLNSGHCIDGRLHYLSVDGLRRVARVQRAFDPEPTGSDVIRLGADPSS